MGGKQGAREYFASRQKVLLGPVFFFFFWRRVEPGRSDTLESHTTRSVGLSISPGVGWGDGGRLYFGVRADKLTAGAFEHAVAVTQTH